MTPRRLSGVPWSRETQYRDRERQRVEIDARGQATTSAWTASTASSGRPTPSASRRTFVWDGVNKREETDKRPAHHKTQFEYDALNRLTKTHGPRRRPSGPDQTVETTYDDAQNRDDEKDRRGFQSRTQTDPLGRVVLVTRALGDAGRGDARDATPTTATATRAWRPTPRAARRASPTTPPTGSRPATDGFESADAAITSFVYDKAGNLPKSATRARPLSASPGR